MPAYLVQGMCYGDEGKGSVVDALVREVKSDLVVRFNGGSQAAHNVITEDGKHHTFAQWGAGTFVPGVRTYLSRFMLVNPVSMLIEEEALGIQGITDTWDRMIVDQDCPIITPFSKAYNRIQEMNRGLECHGSTGMGIGETRNLQINHPKLLITAENICSPSILLSKMQDQRSYYKALIKGIGALVGSSLSREINAIESVTTIDWYIRRYQRWLSLVQLVKGLPKCQNPVFEGAQGVLLDEVHGFQPHTTWTNCTFENANKILDEYEYKEKRYKIGVWRCYSTRHGAGPFPSELDSVNIPESHNKAEAYAGKFRTGTFDLPLALYSNHVVKGIDGFVINHLDCFPDDIIPVRVAREDFQSVGKVKLVTMLEDLLRANCIGVGIGPMAKDKRLKLGEIDATLNNAFGSFGRGKVNSRA